jgi:hypothetical protein
MSPVRMALLSAAISAASTALPAQAQEYAALEQKLGSTVAVAGLFMDNADMNFSRGDRTEGCRQLELARSGMVEAYGLLQRMDQIAAPAATRDVSAYLASTQRLIATIDDIGGSHRCDN